MPEFTLPRTGQQPLAFTGELLASESGHRERLRQWHELAVYRTAKGSYVTQIAYRTEWDREAPYDEVSVLADLPGVAAELTGHNPTIGVIGALEGTKDWVRRRAETIQAVADRYDALVGKVLAGIPGCVERVE